jgi:hypothetical protein
MHCRENQVECEDSKSERWHGPNMEMHSVHIIKSHGPFSMLLRKQPSSENHYRSRDHIHVHELTNHIQHSSIACTRPTVAGSAWELEGGAHVVRNSPSVADRYHRKFD